MGCSDKCVTLRYNGYIEANCDGCMAGLAEMYQDYIDGKKELRDINMEFHARYIKTDDRPDRARCQELDSVNMR